MCLVLAQALPPQLGCFVRFRLVAAPVVVPAASDLDPVKVLVHCVVPVGRLVARSVRSPVLPVPGFPPPQSEPVLLPTTPDPASLTVVPRFRLVPL